MLQTVVAKRGKRGEQGALFGRKRRMAADPAYDCPAFDAGLGRFNSAQPDGARMRRLPGTSKVGISTPNPAGTGELYFEIDAIIYTDVSQKFPADNQQATRVDALVCTFYAGVKATFIDPDKYVRAKLVEATSRATEARPTRPTTTTTWTSLLPRSCGSAHASPCAACREIRGARAPLVDVRTIRATYSGRTRTSPVSSHGRAHFPDRPDRRAPGMPLPRRFVLRCSGALLLSGYA